MIHYESDDDYDFHFGKESEFESEQQPYVYQAKTGDIIVTLRSTFMPHESKAEDLLYIWLYQVNINNVGDVPYKIVKRYWRATDSYARISETKGEGVGGEKPLLNPGEVFEYSSAVHLPTPSGFMSGHYLAESPEGHCINIKIPMVSLDSPYVSMNVQ